MIFYLATILKTWIPALNVVHYVSFRAMAALLSSLGLSFIIGPAFMTFSKRWLRSKAREFTPHQHQEGKNDMPTMGGLFILLVVILSVLLWTNLNQPLIWVFLTCLTGFGAIGGWDDWRKLKTGRGISARLKSSLQCSMAALVGIMWVLLCDPSTELIFPFFKNLHPALGLLFIPWVIFILVGTSNAVNLTDGLDGLAIGSLLINFGTFAIICYTAGHIKIASYLQIPFAGTAELTVAAGSLVGASLGFLWYNTYPAQLFMGDVGSLSLGAGLAFMALAAKQELLLPLAGGLFVLETVSVILQTFSYKMWKRRIFRMAPIHHHFELLGWPESKITVRFSIITVVLCLLALMTLKLR